MKAAAEMQQTLRFRSIITFAAVATGIFTAGCSDNGRYKIYGSVTLKGQPLESGRIHFIPENKGANNQESGALITEGSYLVPKKFGLGLGRHKVLINSGEYIKPGDGGPPGKELLPGVRAKVRERIPEKYNAKTELVIDVKADAPFQFDFDLDGK